MGDFNYRINGIARTDIIDKSRRGDLRDLVLAVSTPLIDDVPSLFHMVPHDHCSPAQGCAQLHFAHLLHDCGHLYIELHIAAKMLS